MYRRMIFIAVLVVTMTGMPVRAHDDDPTYDRVSLSASAEREVENDLLVAVLFAEHQAQRQQAVSEKVNSAIRWALDKTRVADTVKVQTTQYNTSPLYNKSVITGWRARQSIRLESEDSDKLSDLIGDLQERLSIGSVSYAVSKPARDHVEESLISDALAQFRQRADLVTRELGRTSYRIIQIDINTQGAHPMPVAYATRGVAAAMESAAPAIEAGVQTVTVNVSGTIEVDAGPT
jgi:predicted secreted protein